MKWGGGFVRGWLERRAGELPPRFWRVDFDYKPLESPHLECYDAQADGTAGVDMWSRSPNEQSRVMLVCGERDSQAETPNRNRNQAAAVPESREYRINVLEWRDPPGFNPAVPRAIPQLRPVQQELEAIRALCRRHKPISRSQIIAENSLLADALAQCRAGPSFLEVLPTNACNHACPYCFTAGSRSSRRARASQLRAQLVEFTESGGLSVLFSGGGEPLLYRPLSTRCEEFDHLTLPHWLATRGMWLGLITNGSLLPRFIAANRACLRSFSFVRVSLDACSAEEHAQRHRTTAREFESILAAIRSLLRLRGDAPTPAIGISFVVDARSGMNATKQALSNIDALSCALGVDFVQLKHAHTRQTGEADSHMGQLAVHAAALPRHRHEWWIHHYLAGQPGRECLVPTSAQVLRSDGQRSPCCHLQDHILPGPGPHTVTRCPSSVCRYSSMDSVLQRVRVAPEANYLASLRRLKESLQKDGFHPFRLFPSAPDLAWKGDE